MGEIYRCMIFTFLRVARYGTLSVIVTIHHTVTIVCDMRAENERRYRISISHGSKTNFVTIDSVENVIEPIARPSYTLLRLLLCSEKRPSRPRSKLKVMRERVRIRARWELGSGAERSN